MEEKILFSVIVPAYNRENTITKTIDSVLSQSYQNFELIIVDDCSTDGTKKIIKNYVKRDSRVKLISHEMNKGGAAARNTGIEESMGEFCAFLDSDDSWDINKLKVEKEYIKKYPEVKVFYSEIKIYDQRFEKETIYNKRKAFIPLSREKAILAKNFIGTTSCITVSKKALKQVNSFDDELKSCQDWDIYIRLLQNNKSCYIKKRLVNYYLHSDSITASYQKIIQGHEMVFQKIELLTKKCNFFEKRIIKSAHYNTVARIYKRFGQKDKMIKYFLKSLGNNILNFNSLATLIMYSIKK